MFDADFILYSSDTLASQLKHRPGEERIGEALVFAESMDSLGSLQQQGCQYALIGVPEDIGPQGNLGRPGSTTGWLAFLQQFINLQANQYFDGRGIICLGELRVMADTKDLSTDAYRTMCAQLDEQVHAIVKQVFAHNLIPIVIGGGHNNAYPIIKAASETFEMPLAVSNLDPHSDFRATEGRHSGNPFRYAHKEGYLARYTVAGLHEQKNNRDSLNQLLELEFPFYSIQKTHWQRTENFDQVLEDMGRYLLHSGLPTGVELDLDVVSQMPTSAITAAGLSIDDALYYVSQMATLPKCRYLHLAEAAPDANNPDEMRSVGQVLAELVSMFIKSRIKE